LSKTSSYDNYITGSAPGLTASSQNKKINNHFVDVENTGTRLPLLPEIISKRSMKIALITCGNVIDAIPADFYDSQNDRNNAEATFHDLISSPAHLIMGSGSKV
jgi:alkaline phosphatase